MIPGDLDWVRLNHPDLVWDKQRKCLFGELAFRMYYTPNKPNQYYINPVSISADPEGELIEGVYEVDICWKNALVPVVREAGGRIEAAAKKWKVENMIDLHVYPDKTLCLYPKPEEKYILRDDFSLENFFHKILIPFFYYQRYFEQHGNEPWAGYAHGWWGILESYHHVSENQKISAVTVREYLKSLRVDDIGKFSKSTEIKGHGSCFCKSGKIIRKCHKQTAWGFNNLLRDTRLLKIDDSP